MSGEASSASGSTANAPPTAHEDSARPQMGNVLKHIEALEQQRDKLAKQLEEATQRNEKLSTKTREGMQSALDTLMKKWMDAVETKDAQVKDQFKSGLNKLVQNSAEDNGVWQMMVAASSLHDRQAHDLDQLRVENNDLKQKLDGSYASSEARLGKRPADEQLDRAAVAESETSGMWSDFAKDIGGMF